MAIKLMMTLYMSCDQHQTQTHFLSDSLPSVACNNVIYTLFSSQAGPETFKSWQTWHRASVGSPWVWTCVPGIKVSSHRHRTLCSDLDHQYSVLSGSQAADSRQPGQPCSAGPCLAWVHPPVMTVQWSRLRESTKKLCRHAAFVPIVWS